MHFPTKKPPYNCYWFSSAGKSKLWAGCQVLPRGIEICTEIHEITPFPSPPQFLNQGESLLWIPVFIYNEIGTDCHKKKKKKNVHLDSLWKRDWGELGNGYLIRPALNKRREMSPHLLPPLVDFTIAFGVKYWSQRTESFVLVLLLKDAKTPYEKNVLIEETKTNANPDCKSDGLRFDLVGHLAAFIKIELAPNFVFLAPIHWLVHGHVTIKNSSLLPVTQFTVTREMLALGNSKFCFPPMLMFPSTSSRETLRFSGNKIHCSPRDQLLSV